MERQVKDPKLNLGQLLRAAAIAKIDPKDILFNANPWDCQDECTRRAELTPTPDRLAS